MSYAKAMKHDRNPRKWKMTRARKRGNQLIFGAPISPTKPLAGKDSSGFAAEFRNTVV
jgi:hypothetical protein